MKVGQKIVSGQSVSPDTGNAMPLSNIPLGTVISCIEMRPGKGATLARSAGSYAQLMAREGKFATIKLPSGETRLVLNWGSQPGDLDSHLLTPEIEGQNYHISYSNRGSANSAPYATLDTDDVNGYGPETITIKQSFSGT